MPRKDRTYSSSDILRFIRRNLTRKEQREVLDALGATIDDPGPIPVFKDTPAGKKISVDVEKLLDLVGKVGDLVSAAALIPGPQRVALGSIGLALTGVSASVRVLASDVKQLK